MSTRNIKLGAYGGLAGGVVFGAMMGMMGMLPMIGKMVGHPSAVTGGSLGGLRPFSNYSHYNTGRASRLD